MHAAPEPGPAEAGLFGQLGSFVKESACCRKVAQARLQPGQIPQCSQLDVQVAGVNRPGSGCHVVRAGLGWLVLLVDQAQVDQDVSFVIGVTDTMSNRKRLLAPAAGLVRLSSHDERLGHGGRDPGP